MCNLRASRLLTLQSHDRSGEGIDFGSHRPTYFFDHTRTWRASPDEWPAQCRDHLRKTRTLKATHTVHSHIHFNKADIIRMIMIAKWYSGNHGGLKLPDICLKGEEKTRKNHIQEICPARGSNPGAHATACSTAMDAKKNKENKLIQ